MADNPIKTSELFQDDGALKAVLEQLERLLEIVTKLEKTFKDSAGQIQAETRKTSASQKENREGLEKNYQAVKELAKANEALVKAKSPVAKQIEKIKESTREQNQIIKQTVKLEKEKQFATDKTAQELEKLKAETKDLTKENRLSLKIDQSKEGSYNRLSAQYSKLKMEINAMSLEERENTKEGREKVRLSKQIYEEMTRLQMVTGKHQLKVGSYTEAVRESNMSLQEMRRELRMLREISLEGKTEAEIRDLNQAIGELSDNMKKYQQEQEAFGMDNMEMIAGASRAATGAIQGLAGAFNVLGVESEILRRVQQNMVSMIAISQALRAIEEAYHKRIFQTMAARIKDTAATIKNTIARRANQVATAQASRTEAAHAKMIAAKTVATKASTTATWLFNAALRALMGPVGWILLAVGAVVSALAVYSRRLRQNREEEMETIEVKNGIVAANERLASSVDQNAVKLQAYLKAVNDTSRSENERLRSLEKITELTNGFVKANDLSAESLREVNKQAEVYLNNLRMMARANAAMEQIIEFERELMQLRLDMVNVDELLQPFDLTFDIDGELNVDMSNLENLPEAVQEEYDRAVELARVAMLNDPSIDFQTALRNELMTTRKLQEQNLKALEAEVDRVMKYYLDASLSVQDLSGETVDAASDAAKEIVDIEQKRLEILAQLKRQEDDLGRNLIENEFQRRRAMAEHQFKQSEESLNKMLDDMELEEAEREQLYNRFIERHLQVYKREILNIERDITAARKAELEQRFRDDMEAFNLKQELAASEFNIVNRTEIEKRRFVLQQQLERYREEIANAIRHGDLLSDTEIQILRNHIKRVENELEGLAEKRDIWSLIGLDISPEQSMAIQTSTQFALQQLQQLIQARMQAAQAAVQAANMEVSAARQRVDEERQAAQEGYANRLEIAEQELMDAEAREQKALKMQERAQKQQEKIQKRQQVGSMITASARIWADLGFPLAIAALGLMWGSFFASQRKAKKLKAESYGKGHYEVIRGGSHQSGRDVALGIDEKNRRVEGSESFAVFTKQATRKYGSWLPDFVNKANNLQLGYDSREIVNMINLPSNDNSRMEKLLKDISESAKSREFVDPKGRIVWRDGNITRIYNV